ncbi:MAG: hypothetical protein ACRELC_12320 [Gemmatimonadota bacterium]
MNPRRGSDLRVERGVDRPARGFAVPMVIAFLVALGFLGAGAVWLTMGSLRVGTLYAAHDRASRTADAVLQRAVAVFADSGPAPGAWPVTGTLDGHAYTATIARDSFDFGTGLRPVFLDAAGGDRRNSDGDGDPIYVISAAATRGPWRATQSLWITRRATFDLPAAFSINARGAARWEGGWTISGTNVTADGAPVDPTDASTAGACDENRAAILLTRSDASIGALDVTVSGNPAYAGESPPYTRRGGASWSGAEEVLGVDEGTLVGRARTGLQHHVQRPDTLSGLTWITDQAGGGLSCLTRHGCGNIDGSGVLIVHNPRYDPRVHDPTDPRYDLLASLDPRNRPARLLDLRGGTFHGLVVVDKAPATPSAAATIHGAVVVLSSASNARFDWPAGSVVRYSCDALSRAARSLGLPPRRLAWKGS